MGQAIQQCARQPFAAQHFSPLFKGQIGGDDQAGAFIGPAHHVEEQFGPGLGERDVAEFVEEQHVQPLQLFVQPLQGFRLALFEQLRHQSGGGGEGSQARSVQPGCW